jgi:hypothetical protein
MTSGIETTTGPLGQGCGNSVGMAIASRWLGARYNAPGRPLFDYDTYVLCSDGDLMEGVSAEAASIAGHLELANLCWIYDDNKITIEGETHLAFTENVGQRFEGLMTGLWVAGEKLGLAIGAGTLGLALSLIGFQSGSASQTQEVVHALRLLVGLGPLAFAVAGLGLLLALARRSSGPV